MTTREYLSQIYKIHLMLEAKLDEQEKLRALACRITVPTDGERVKSSSNPDRMTNIVAKIVELDKEIEKEFKDLVQKKNKIIHQIDTIENASYYSVLTFQYVQFLQTKEIADKMGISKQAMFKLKSAALIEFERRFGSEYLTPADVMEKEREES